MRSVNICIAGGGSTYTPGILLGIIKKIKTFPVKKLVLFDNNKERLEKMGKYAQILFNDYLKEVEVIYTTEPKVAYTDIDFVFCQIRTGGLKMREKDEKIPLSHGVIGQETCGPGGFAYGIRSIRDMIQHVKDVRTYSKDAWILNYTNPAAIVAIALDMAFPDDKRILNICDGPISLLMSYARILGDGITYRDMRAEYFGLNHFGWFTKITDLRNNEDITQKIKDLILKDGFYPANKEERDPSWLVTYASVQRMLELDDTYLPNTYLQYYLLPRASLSHLDPNRTRANEVMDGRERRVYEACDKAISDGTTKTFLDVQKEFNKKDAHGEMIVSIAESIFNDENRFYVVIVKNDNIITNIDQEAMVEVLCTLGKDGYKPYKQVGKIDTYYKGLIENQYAYEKLTVEAYFEGSYKKALQALTLNRTVVDQELANDILKDLIVANIGYWPELK